MSARDVKRKWTDEEMGFLISCEWPVREIAEALGRSEAGVIRKRSLLRRGWEPSPAAADDWTRDEDEVLLATPRLSAREVSRLLLGRSAGAVKHRRQQLAKIHSVDFGDYATRNKDPRRVGRRPLVAKTCPRCGLLLDSSWFRFYSDRRIWGAHCKGCESGYPSRTESKGGRVTYEQRRDFADKMAALTGAQAENRGQPYTERDCEVLANPDLTILEKALLLRRTWAGVASACHSYGYPSRRDGSLGDPSEARWFIDAPGAESLLEATA